MTTTPTAAPPRENLRRASLAGLIGTALEQYDFVIYGTASALVFSQIFFPEDSTSAALVKSFGIYAAGFLTRPLGGMFFSRYGDRLGRKWILVATLLFMGGSTLAIGLLPTYAQIGVWAPVLLVLLRCLQGFGAGAEQSGGATMLTECAPAGRRGRYASLVMVGAALGTALGAVVWIAVQRLPEEDLMSWGWRLVFLSSIVVTLGALVIRSKLRESPVFEEVSRNPGPPPAPLREVWAGGKLHVLRLILMNWGVSTQSYTIQVFMASFLITVVEVDAAYVPDVLLIGALCGAVAAFAMGALSDRVGRRRLYSVLVAALVLYPVPAFLLLTTGSHLAIALVVVVGFVVGVHGLPGIQMSYFPEIFGSRYRYAGVTLGREFSSVIGGGLAPLICTSLLAAFSNSWVPVAGYLVLTTVVSLVAVRLSPETLDRDLTDPRDARRTDREQVLTP